MADHWVALDCQQHEARVQFALDTAQLLNPERSEEERALFGLLHLAAALSYAKIGHEGDAWRHWDHADQAAAALGDDYVHPWLMFGRGTVDAYTVTNTSGFNLFTRSAVLDLAEHGGATVRPDAQALARDLQLTT